jgi:hypothetical protein
MGTDLGPTGRHDFRLSGSQAGIATYELALAKAMASQADPTGDLRDAAALSTLLGAPGPSFSHPPEP